MDRVLKVAVPPLAATVVVPLSVPPPGLVPMARVTLAVLLVRLLNASRTCTVTAGLMAIPAVVVVGCWGKGRGSGAAALSGVGALGAGGREGGAERANAVAQRAVGRQGGVAVRAREVDCAAIARRRVVERILCRDREAEGAARGGAAWSADREVRRRCGTDGDGVAR